jgi:hypothetical protein
MLNTPAGFREAMRVAARRASIAVPEEVQVRRFLLADMPVEITFTGLTLCHQFTRSLSHLMVGEFGDRQPVLRIELWDGLASGVERPIGDLRDVYEDTSPFGDGILTRSTDGEHLGHQTPRACTLMDTESHSILGWVSSAEALSRSEIGKPLQPILFAWYNSRGIQPVHAGLISRGEQGVLIGGAGGSGKSTTSLLCVQAGFSYLADDYVGLPPVSRHGQTAYSFYTSLWLEEEHSKRFERLLANRMNGQLSGEVKLPFGIAEAFPKSMAARCIVCAVVLPQVAHIPVSRLRRATTAEALLKLAPSSVLQLPFIQPGKALQRISEMLRRVPSFWLDLGTDFDSIPLRIDEALEQAMGFADIAYARST